MISKCDFCKKVFDLDNKKRILPKKIGLGEYPGYHYFITCEACMGAIYELFSKLERS